MDANSQAEKQLENAITILKDSFYNIKTTSSHNINSLKETINSQNNHINNLTSQLKEQESLIQQLSLQNSQTSQKLKIVTKNFKTLTQQYSELSAFKNTISELIQSTPVSANAFIDATGNDSLDNYSNINSIRNSPDGKYNSVDSTDSTAILYQQIRDSTSAVEFEKFADIVSAFNNGIVSHTEAVTKLSEFIHDEKIIQSFKKLIMSAIE